MFKGMTLLELAEFWNEDWKKPIHELSTTDIFNEWEDAVTDRGRNASALKTLQFLDKIESEEMVDCIDNIRDRFKEEFFYTELQQIAELRVTVDILLEHHRHDNANVSIGQLENLKQREMHQGRY